MEKIKLFIYGASGHGKVVADIAKDNGFKEIIFIDDGDNKYLTFENIKTQNHIPIALGIGDNSIRNKIFKKLKRFNFNIITLIHSSAIISDNVTILDGSVVMPNVVINTNTKVGKGVILNTSCIIEHDNIIKDFVHISPNAALAGNVKVGKFTHIGIGSSVIQNIQIEKKCIIGAGSVVIKNITKNTKCAGVPAKKI